MSTDPNVDPATNLEETNQTNPVTQTPEASQEKMLSQADVTGLVAKEAKKAQEKLLRELGLGEDITGVKDGLQRFQQWQEEQKTDVERIQGEREAIAADLAKAQEKHLSLEFQLKAIEKDIPEDRRADYIELAMALLGDDKDPSAALDSALTKFPLPQTAPPETKQPLVPGIGGNTVIPPPVVSKTNQKPSERISAKVQRYVEEQQ